MKTILITLITLSGISFSHAQTSDFKHDIGLRLSSNNYERYRLDYRYHKNERWTLSVGAYFGSNNSFVYNGTYLNDTTYQAISHQFDMMSYGVSFGMQRKLNFMKYNFYYVGADLGVGAVSRKYTNSRFVYDVDPTSTDLIIFTNLIEDEQNVNLSNALNVNTRLFAGADVPIVDRLALNLEIGLLSGVESSRINGIQTTYFNLIAYASGGLRYRFGKNTSD